MDVVNTRVLQNQARVTLARCTRLTKIQDGSKAWVHGGNGLGVSKAPSDPVDHGIVV
jgi:hypothetical protein